MCLCVYLDVSAVTADVLPRLGQGGEQAAALVKDTVMETDVCSSEGLLYSSSWS